MGFEAHPAVGEGFYVQRTGRMPPARANRQRHATGDPIVTQDDAMHDLPE